MYVRNEFDENDHRVETDIGCLLIFDEAYKSVVDSFHLNEGRNYICGATKSVFEPNTVSSRKKNKQEDNSDTAENCHAIIHFEQGEFFIEDNNSQVGTFRKSLNFKLKPFCKYELVPGEDIYFGNLKAKLIKYDDSFDFIETPKWKRNSNSSNESTIHEVFDNENFSSKDEVPSETGGCKIRDKCKLNSRKRTKVDTRTGAEAEMEIDTFEKPRNRQKSQLKTDSDSISNLNSKSKLNSETGFNSKVNCASEFELGSELKSDLEPEPESESESESEIESHNKENISNNTNSLDRRRKKSPLKQNHNNLAANATEPNKVTLLWTGCAPTNKDSDLIKKANISVIDSEDLEFMSSQVTHVIAPSIKRTLKFLWAILNGIPIISPASLRLILSQYKNKSLSLREFNDSCLNHLLSDPEGEKKFGFSLKDSINKAKKHSSIFNSLKFAISPTVKVPSIGEIKWLLKSGNARVIEFDKNMKTTDHSTPVIFIGTQSDHKLFK
ncbi:BRCA1 domain-containing protein [Cryptosporidium felis]|nr:BRCA1 domain-containing protein [Cryptosporidium felis]